VNAPVEDAGRTPANARRWRQAMREAKRAVVVSWPQQVREANAIAKGHR
jgi:hypothetical protein